MPIFQLRGIVNGQMIGRSVELDEEPTEEEAQELLMEQLDTRGGEPIQGVIPPRKDEKMNGKEIAAIQFRCATCGEMLSSVFQDGYLEVKPCPICLGELQNIVAAAKRFMGK